MQFDGLYPFFLIKYLLNTALMLYGTSSFPLEAKAPRKAAASVVLWKHSVDCWKH